MTSKINHLMKNGRVSVLPVFLTLTILTLPACFERNDREVKPSINDTVPTQRNRYNQNSREMQPSIVGTVPTQAALSGNTLLAVFGVNFQTGATVVVGGMPCIHPAYSSYRISCQFGPGRAPGFVDVTVTNPDRSSATKIRGFEYTSVPQGPVRFTEPAPRVARFDRNLFGHTPAAPSGPPTLVRPLVPAPPAAVTIQTPVPVVTFPAAEIPPSNAFGTYRDSEAQVLQHFFNIRVSADNRWLDHVTLNNRQVAITNDSTPPQMLRGYVISDSDLVNAINDSAIGIRIAAGEMISQDHVDALPEEVRSDLVAFIGMGVEIHNERFPNPAFSLRTTTSQQQLFIDRLQSYIRIHINELNESSPERYQVTATQRRPAYSYYMNPRHLTYRNQLGLSARALGPDLRTDYDYWPMVHTNPHDKEVMIRIIESIETNNVNQFISYLIEFATSFNEELTGPKSAFIDTFTFLFVTKYFPNEAVRQLYYHFILRCGQIH
ncbi:MAG: IPT/TIG domain-containing protein [Bdellovibrionia bacterium]